MAVAWGMLVGLVMWFLGSSWLKVLGAEPEARHQGTVYLKAAAVGMISVSPFGKTARTSRARMVSFTFSLRACLRGGNFLPGVMS